MVCDILICDSYGKYLCDIFANIRCNRNSNCSFVFMLRFNLEIPCFQILNFSFLFRCLSVFAKLTKNKISSGAEIHVIFLTVTCILIVIHYTFTELYILELFRSFNQFFATYQLGSNFIVRHISFLRLISSTWTFPFVISVFCGIAALSFLFV